MVHQHERHADTRDARHPSKGNLRGCRRRRGDRGAHASGIGNDERREHRRRQKPDKADRACGLGEKRAQVAPLRAAKVYRHDESDCEEYGKHAGNRPHCGLNSRTDDSERHNTADREQHERHNLQNASELARPCTKVASLGRFKRDPQAPRRQAHRETEKPDKQRVRGDEPQKRDTRVITVRRHGNTRERIAHGNPEQKRRQERPHDEAHVPHARPASVVGAKLKRNGAHDKPEEHEHHREVETRERRGVCCGKRREQRTARREQPNLVAVPHRADAAADICALGLVLRKDRVEHTRAQVESVEHEIARNQHEDQEEPQYLKNRHYCSPPFSPAPATARFPSAALAAPSSGPCFTKWEMTRTQPMRRNR